MKYLNRVSVNKWGISASYENNVKFFNIRIPLLLSTTTSIEKILFSAAMGFLKNQQTRNDVISRDATVIP